jgi:hypothetical protein
VPVKTIGPGELDVLVRTAERVPTVQIVAVGRLVATANPPANLVIVDRDCPIYSAMNIGAETATSDYLLFMGIDDVLLVENVPHALLEIQAARRASLFVMPFSVGSRLVVQRAVAGRIRAFHHQGVLFERAALLREGGYSDRFRLHADLELMLRLQRQDTPTTLSRPLVRFSKGGMSTSGRHAITSIREFFAIYSEQRVSKLTGSFLFHIALLIWYRLHFFARAGRRS